MEVALFVAAAIVGLLFAAVALKADYDARTAARQISWLTDELYELRARLARLERGQKKNSGDADREAPKTEHDSDVALPPLSPQGSNSILSETAEPVQPAKQPAEPVHASLMHQEEFGAPPPPKLQSATKQKSGFDPLEEAVGKRWITWIGAVVLFIGVAFFLKYAIERDIVSPAVRVSSGAAFGLVLIAAGYISMRRDWRAFGQGLAGVGLAVLYASLFTAAQVYDLIPQSAAFAGMVIVTAGGMSLAIKADAQPLAILTVMGGLLTPVLVSQGMNQRDTLFTYLLLLDLGAFGIALFKEWKHFDHLTFIGTWLLTSGWFLTQYSEDQLVPSIVWVGVFNLLFLVLPLIFHLRHRREANLPRFMLELANFGITMLLFYALLMPEHRLVLGHLTLWLGFTSFVMAWLARWRINANGETARAFIGLFAMVLTLALFIYCRARGLAPAWGAEAVMLLLFGYLFKWKVTRIIGFVSLVLASVKMLINYIPLHHADFTPIVNSSFLGAFSVVLAGAAFAVIGRFFREKSTSRADAITATAAGVTAGFLALILLNVEYSEYFYNTHQSLVGSYFQIMIWSLGAVVFAGAGVFARRIAARLAAGMPLFVACVYGFNLYFEKHSFALMINGRFAMCLMLFASSVAVGLILRRSSRANTADRIFGNILYIVAGTVLFALLSAEFYTWSRSGTMPLGQARWMAQMSLTIVWGVYAIGLLIFGFNRNLRPVRFAALGVFGLAALKLVLVDMASVEQLYRILSFFIVGSLMIGASFLYHRVEKHLQQLNETT